MNRLRTAAWAFCGLASCGGRTLDDIFVGPAASPAVVSVVTDAGAETGPKDASVDADAAPAKVPLPDSATVVDLGLRTTGELVTFPIPAGTLGFQLVVQAPDEDALVRIDRLVSPSGQVLFEEGKPRGTELPTAEGFGWATAAVPQSDVYSKSPVESGVFSAKVFGEVSGRVLRVSLVLQKTKDGFFHGGELDLHVYVPKGLMLSQPGLRHEVTAQGAAVDDALQARIDAFYELLDALVGVQRGAVSYHGIGARFTSVLDEPSLRAAFQETRVTPAGQALHVVFTNDLGEALGVAPAIPGFAVTTGTSMSAIAVTQYEDSSPEVDAFTMLHEMGHFAGLSHTTEINFDTTDAGGPPYYDPLADTPRCNGGVTAENALDCPDYRNVMFPTGDQSTGLLSTGQERVLRGSPIYRARASGPSVFPPRRPLADRFVVAGHSVLRRCVLLRGRR